MFYNNESECSWYVFIPETMYNLSIPNYYYLLPQHEVQVLSTKPRTRRTPALFSMQSFKYASVASIIADDSGILIGHLSVTSSGAPDFDAANNWDGAYLGPFM